MLLTVTGTLLTSPFTFAADSNPKDSTAAKASYKSMQSQGMMTAHAPRAAKSACYTDILINNSSGDAIQIVEPLEDEIPNNVTEHVQSNNYCGDTEIVLVSPGGKVFYDETVHNDEILTVSRQGGKYVVNKILK